MEFDLSSADSRIFKQILALLVQIVVVVTTAWFVVFGYGKPVVNTGQSMQPILEDEDTVAVDRITYRFSDIRRYDVIAFYMTEADEESDRATLKRVIGLPGETIQISEGQVLINGEARECEQGWLEADMAGLASSPVTLGEDEYFVLGDNKSASEDSRFSSVGNVRKEQILGRVWAQVRPFTHFKFISRVSAQE